MTTIGTGQLYDRTRQRMAALDARADMLQSQIASGRKVSVASDDVAGWTRLQRLARIDADDTAWTANLTIAASTLAQTDTALASVTSRIQRAQELAVQANSDILSPTDRAVIATELDAIVADLHGLAGSKDAQGGPLFGTTAATIPIADGQSVQVAETAARTFGTGSDEVTAVISALAAALRGTGSPTTGAATAGNALDAAAARVSGIRAAVGARAARVDLVSDRLRDAAVNRAGERNAIEAVDVPAAITELQKTMTVLEATQASFSKLSQLSLFNYLR